MCLRFVFLLITPAAGWLRLFRREEGVQDSRDLDPASPARRTATAAAAPAPELGGPGPARDPAQRDTQSTPPGATAAGHPGHYPALAPRHPPPPLGRQVHARQGRPPGHPPQDQGPGSPARSREPRMGLPQDPRRAGRPRSEDSGVDGVGNPEEGRNRPRAATDRAYLGRSSCAPRPRRSWRATASPPTCSTVPRPTSWP
jgi:hypothetical protein